MRTLKNIIEENGGLEGLLRGEALKVIGSAGPKKFIRIKCYGGGPWGPEISLSFPFIKGAHEFARVLLVLAPLNNFAPVLYKKELEGLEIHVFEPVSGKRGHNVRVNPSILADLRARARVLDRELDKGGF